MNGRAQRRTLQSEPDVLAEQERFGRAMFSFSHHGLRIPDIRRDSLPMALLTSAMMTPSAFERRHQAGHHWGKDAGSRFSEKRLGLIATHSLFRHLDQIIGRV